MSAYADVGRVKTILESELEPDLTIFDALNLTASNELDAACGVEGFGTDPLPRTLTFGSHYPYPYGVTPYGYPRVVLDPPVLNASTVSTATVPLDPTAYRLLWPSFDRYGGIALTSAPWWNGEVTITGDFADLPPGPVPPEIVEAA